MGSRAAIKPITLAVLTALGKSPYAIAAGELEEIVVTGTRRDSTVQDVPINIAAVGGAQIESLGLTELADLLSYVPGINVVDKGGRQGNPIIVRGLNVAPIASGDQNNNGGGGTVATYVGDIPLYVDLKLNDLERVEVLLGPQGTLYGAGTLGGAIRYIPAEPDLDNDLFRIRAQAYSYSEASSVSGGGGLTFNKAFSDTLAVRGSIDLINDSGFIDYVNVVREPGVSNPNPDFSDPNDVAANLRTVKDADYEDATSGRWAARWQPNDAIEGTLTYYYQQSDVGARRISHHRDDVATGRYEAAFLVEEPNERTNDLIALELTADLGFAELTSATGFSTYDEQGQRDQTPLLIQLEYSYEQFPSFTGFTKENVEEARISQELRIVSRNVGPFSWIVGGFYNEFDRVSASSEFTPNYDTYAINTLGFDFLVNRPDDLEYFEQFHTVLKEFAIFGEVAYDITDRLSVTLGGRFYDYDLESFAQVDFPLLDLGFASSSLAEISRQPFDPDLAQSDDGTLFKANLSYQLTDDALVYVTVSEGFRIGGVNGVAECPVFDPASPMTQGACALAPGQVFAPGGPNDVSDRDERQYAPDETRNYEVGFKSAWNDNTFVLNGAIYFVDWLNPQVLSSTVNASIPITVNGGGAEATGIELTMDWRVNDRFRLRGNASRINAELTSNVPDLITTISPPGFGNEFEDGIDGDRLPGSPETQITLYGIYDVPLSNGNGLTFNAGYAWQSDVLTRAGGRGNGLTLDSFGVVNVSAEYRTEHWSATLFVNNAFDEFAETGVNGTSLSNQLVTNFDGGRVFVRGYRTHVLPPRSAGIRFSYEF